MNGVPSGLVVLQLRDITENRRLAGSITTTPTFVANRWIVRVTVEDEIELAVFADGRTIVSGTRDEARARGLVARYVGA